MENFAYFFKHLTKEATDDDHYKVSDMPENLQVFASLETDVLDEIIKNGVTLEFSHMKFPKLKRGDFRILREMNEAKKCGFLLMLNDQGENQPMDSPESRKTPIQTESESRKTPIQTESESSDSRNSSVNTFDTSSAKTSDEKQNQQSPEDYVLTFDDIVTQSFFLRHF